MTRTVPAARAQRIAGRRPRRKTRQSRHTHFGLQRSDEGPPSIHSPTRPRTRPWRYPSSCPFADNPCARPRSRARAAAAAAGPSRLPLQARCRRSGCRTARPAAGSPHAASAASRQPAPTPLLRARSSVRRAPLRLHTAHWHSCAIAGLTRKDRQEVAGSSRRCTKAGPTQRRQSVPRERWAAWVEAAAAPQVAAPSGGRRS
eukprot:scaffold116207_cov57-Phaeocystis_antarctica.AAC.2